ncbi:MAG: hypothetical protein ACLTKH_09755 [Eubacterium sp.]
MTPLIFLANAVYYLEQELRKHGYDSILCCTGKDYKEDLELLLSKRVDGIILAVHSLLRIPISTIMIT